MAARTKNAYVWQQGRFDGDVDFWKEGLSNPEVVKPVKDGQCLRLFLAPAADFRFFHNAATQQLQLQSIQKLQLLAQAAIVAISMGVGFAGIAVSKEVPTIMIISVALGTILTALYVSEDRLISYIIANKKSIAVKVAGEEGKNLMLYNLESSPEAREYVKDALAIRLIAQLIAFLLIPAIIFCYRITSITPFTLLCWLEMTMNVVLALTTTALLLGSFFVRYKHLKGASQFRVDGKTTT